MSQAPRVHLTAAALLCAGFLLGSHPLVTSHPLLRGLEPGRADAEAAVPRERPLVCPDPASTDTPTVSTRLARLREAELEELVGRNRPLVSIVAAAPRPAAFATGTMVPGVEANVLEMTATPEGRRHFETWLERRRRHEAVIREAFTSRGLPQELEAVAFIESDLVPTAVSRVGATGLWQFMPGTARAYGLTVEPGYDARMHVVRATDAAAQYLRDLYDHFGTWELALAAYNSGFGRIARVVERTGSRDFWSVIAEDDEVPHTTPQYVARVLAAAHVLRQLPRFGFTAPAPLAHDIVTSTVTVPSGAAVWQVARSAGITEEELRTLNPEILGDVFPDAEDTLTVQLPRERAERARVMLPLIGGEVDATSSRTPEPVAAL